MTNKIQAEIDPTRHGETASVVRFLDHKNDNLAQELLTIGDTIEKAIGRAVIKDDNQRNKIIRYLGRLKECNLLPQMELLRIWINASFAVGGHQRDEALMSNANLWVPEGGRKMDRKQINKLLESRMQQNQGNAHNDNEGDNHNQ